MPEEVQAQLKKKRERNEQEEQKRQAQIELGLKREVLQRIQLDMEDECLDKEAKQAGRERHQAQPKNGLQIGLLGRLVLY